MKDEYGLKKVNDRVYIPIFYSSIFSENETFEEAQYKFRETTKLSSWKNLVAENIWKSAWKILHAAWKVFVKIENWLLDSDFMSWIDKPCESSPQ